MVAEMSSTTDASATPQEALETTSDALSRSERAERALAAIDLSGEGLEIGPSYDPLVPKASGAHVEIVDHLTTGELIKKYQDLGVTPDKITAIEEVDHIWSGGRLVDAVGRRGDYDYVVAAHLIEHMVDLIGFLQDCQELLGPNGRLALVVPDQRFCFDFFKSATSAGQVVDAHLNPTRFHSPGTLLEHGLYDCATDGHTAWASGQGGPITLCHNNFDYARAVCDQGLAQEKYVDAHHWKFTPASFSLLVQDLRDLGHHSFVEVASHPTVGFEFYSTLALGESKEHNRKDRLALLKQARAEQVEVSPTYVAFRAAVDHALDLAPVNGGAAPPVAELNSLLATLRQRAVEAEARSRRAEADFAELKASRSWRVTRPLRGLTDLARRLRVHR